MKLILGIFIFLSQYSFGQTYKYPKCNSQEDSNLKILKITRDDYSTIIDFEYIRSEAQGIYIFLNPPNTDGSYYIKADGKTYKLTSTNGIGNTNGITPASQYKPVNFSATFEAIPKSVTQFDLIEGSSTGSWHFYGITLISSNNTRDETKILKSEAKMRESDNPLSKLITVIPAGTSIKILSFSISGYYKAEYKGQIGYLNEIYFQSSQINSSSSSKTWDEYNLKEHWKTNGMSKFEGIYESIGSYTDIEVPCTNRYGQTICYMTWRSYDVKYQVALVKQASDYNLIYLSGNPKGSEKIGGCNCDGESYLAPTSNHWKIGEVKARLYKTATPDFYKCDWFMGDKTLNPDGYITFENYAYFTLLLSGEKLTYLKLYPTVDENIEQNTNKIEKSSGTGYAISSNGYIATNHHVTNGATSIKVRGVNGDFSKTYSAKVIVDDKNNDLSIVKIDDPNFTTLGTIPYIIANRASDVGSSIFVLGYPLRATMGDEVKLTNGIISSKSGFQGDITSYQITAPVQPGNSGGPLFDDKGNIIGIINAKHVGAENASYAVKASYLMNLIDLMPTSPKLQTISTVTGKPLTEQVKILKKFTYIIEINQ
ncbi:S1C family serine protease [Flavobacterium piscisymbiosum]|uniref:Serine protease n=1 Tax=Flavobacterium piscisymbiosum TaxID=2893753 RepID=A0ABS8M7G6_9FLAO|nr:trypsin-like peptidase domain-containing protein [Flavobacterium sp. F-30]MCC9061446.1 serine protease [Flavobacterium sp. F-30]